MDKVKLVMNDCIDQINTYGFVKIDGYPLDTDEKYKLIYKFQETDIYFLDITPNKEWVFRKRPKPLPKIWYRQDWAIHIRNALFTALFSLIVGWLLLRPKSRELNQQYEKLNNRLDSLKTSIFLK